MSSIINILAIESSCDETSAAVIQDGAVLSNHIATQKVHERYGGVVPELASRAHMQNIVPVVDAAIKDAAIDKKDIIAVAFTQSPGLIGSLLVGTCFAKGYAQALNIPLIAVHHMQAHVLAHFIDNKPDFPFLCLTVSGGHTQIVLCRDYLDMEVLGETIDDAAGEAFDKVAKMLGLQYPGGPLVDKYAASGDPLRFKFPSTEMKGYEFSFSGIKTSVLYFLQAQRKIDPDFAEKNINDICASVQYTIVKGLVNKLEKAAKELGIKHIGIAGGVSANSGLRKAVKELGERNGWEVYIPRFEYCTDNAAMIGITGYHKFLKGAFTDLSVSPSARATWAMSNAYFQFKQFRVDQQHCAMKVTTDACIQGAWTPVLPDVKKVLDIGAGTGLLSLMLAQRALGIVIDAIELETEAAAQAGINAETSPWKDRINILTGDAAVYDFPAKYDLIISNPPFFNNSLLGSNADKNQARHTVSLTYAALLKVIDDNLKAHGYASVLLPYTEYLQWKALLDRNSWYEHGKLSVCHRSGAHVKRVVCLFGRHEVDFAKEEALIIQNDQQGYTARFIELLAPFYLNL